MTKYLDDNGTGVKPKQTFTEDYKGIITRYGRNQYFSRVKMWVLK